MSTVYMIRHGQASFGQSDYDRLSALGAKQAHIVARHLGRLGVVFDAVYVGPLRRQRQTAATMAEACAGNGQSFPPLQPLAELEEYDAAGLWRHLRESVLARHPELAADRERLHRDPRVFQRLFSRIVQSWVAGEHPSAHLESWAAFGERIRQGLHRIMRREGAGRHVAVVTSAGPVAVAVQMAAAVPDVHCADLSWQILNASTTRFRYQPERFTMMGFNDVAALELEGDPELLTYR
ncbi:MAG: histidine phosphatase family protein [Desulfobacterales bacterium]|nr:histidine phosphatase family protein [Desulfobacterales bacterium]